MSDAKIAALEARHEEQTLEIAELKETIEKLKRWHDRFDSDIEANASLKFFEIVDPVGYKAAIDRADRKRWR